MDPCASQKDGPQLRFCRWPSLGGHGASATEGSKADSSRCRWPLVVLCQISGPR